jgi:outer membrane protein assembly factor BamB
MKKLSITSVRMIATVIGCLMLQSLCAQWPQFRGPMRNGICSESKLLKEWPEYGPKLLWSADTIGDGFASAVIQNNIVYTAGKKDSVEFLTALDMNGKLLWQQPIGRASTKDWWPQGRSTPTIYKNKIYAITVLGDIACFDAKTGKEDWKLNGFEKFEGIGYDLRYGGIAESPLIIDDKLIITPCGKKTTMVALNCLDGKTIWTSESIGDTSTYTSPVLIQDKDKKIIITSTANYTIAVDFNNGKIIWKDKLSKGILPLVDKNRFYFNGDNFLNKGGRMYGLNNDLNNCSVLWKDTINANYMGGTLLIGNKIFGSSESKQIGLFCMDAGTGKLNGFNKEINGCNMIAADGMIYCYEDKSGRVCLLKNNENSLSFVSSFKVKLGNGPNLAHLSIANGLLFIRHGKVLMAYDIKQI